jgi:hypothetical protein
MNGVYTIPRMVTPATVFSNTLQDITASPLRRRLRISGALSSIGPANILFCVLSIRGQSPRA